MDVKPDFAMLQAEALLAPGVDKQAWKKQQRMIRNRESAALSRKRKRDRIESLEEQVSKQTNLQTAAETHDRTDPGIYEKISQVRQAVEAICFCLSPTDTRHACTQTRGMLRVGGGRAGALSTLSEACAAVALFCRRGWCCLCL